MNPSLTKSLVWTVAMGGALFVAPKAEAVTPRAYVSVNGNDANVCNVPATPCRTFVGAISQVSPGGIVIVMDSGTFGGGTISQAVTIDAPSGVLAVAATLIVVDPGAGNVVVLRGVTFQAPSPGTGTGIVHSSGTLFVENVVVDGWFQGLYSSPGAQALFVRGSVFRNQTSIALAVTIGATVKVAIDDSVFEHNQNGLALFSGTGRVSNTVISGSTNNGAYALNVDTVFTFERCQVSDNYIGLLVDSGSTLRVSQSTITGNGTGLRNNGTGTPVLESFGNNVLWGNTSFNTSGTITPRTLQ
jgi:hypothetical protein